MDALARALAAAHDPLAAVEALLDAWREVPAVELVAAIDGLGRALPRPAVKLHRVKAWRSVVAKRRTADVPAIVEALGMPWVDGALHELCAWPADPRIAMALARGVARLKHGAFRAQIVERLVAIGDPASLAVLATELARPPAVTPKPAQLSAAARAQLDRFHAARAAAVAADRAFVDQVLAAPDDDGPRQVYGDWLQERGDPRGEFIALQFRRHRGRMSQPERKRERELMFEYGAVWLGSLDHPQVTAIDYERGFVSAIGLGALDDALVDAPDWATVRRIQLAGYYHPPDRVRSLVAQPALRGLRELGEVEPSAVDAIGSVPEPLALEWLAIVNAERGDAAAMRRLPALANVRRVAWRGSLDPLVESDLLAQLRSLEIRDNQPEIGRVLRTAHALDELVVRAQWFELRFCGPRLCRLEVQRARAWREVPAALGALLGAIPANQLSAVAFFGADHAELRRLAMPMLVRQALASVTDAPA